MRKEIFIILLFIICSCAPKMPFDKDKWNIRTDIDYDFRKQMLDDLVTNHLKTTINKDSIIKLLGEPSSIDTSSNNGTEFYYNITTDFGWDIDPVKSEDLVITFNKESTLYKVYLETWERKKETIRNEIKK